MILKAVGDSVILKKVNLEEKTKSGIIIKSNDFYPIYEIVSIGDDLIIYEDAVDNSYKLKVGDYVMIPNTVGNPVIYENVEYRYCKSWEILCTVEL